MANPFGETIRDMRMAQEMGLRTAAERLGISPAYLSRVERGKERPPRPQGNRLSGITQVVSSE